MSKDFLMRGNVRKRKDSMGYGSTIAGGLLFNGSFHVANCEFKVAVRIDFTAHTLNGT